jgi:hypothetical protein
MTEVTAFIPPVVFKPLKPLPPSDEKTISILSATETTSINTSGETTETTETTETADGPVETADGPVETGSDTAAATRVCRSCGYEWYASVLYCKCGEVNVFQTIAESEVVENLLRLSKMSLEDKGKLLAWNYSDGVARITSELNKFPPPGNTSYIGGDGKVIYSHTKGRNSYDILCGYDNNKNIGLSAPTIEYMTAFLKAIIASDKPKCLTMAWSNTGDKTGHAVVCAVYPNGTAYIIDPNGKSYLKPGIIPFDKLEDLLDTYFRQVRVVESKFDADGGESKVDITMSVVPQEAWTNTSNFNKDVTRAIPNTGRLSTATGICATVGLILASLIVEHDYSPYQAQLTLATVARDPHVYSIFVEQCLDKICRYF